MIHDAHPLHQVIELVKNKDDLVLQFAEYSYKPQLILDERRCFDVSARMLNEQWLLKQLESLPKNKEIALHSLIKVNKKSMHIPMIDFCCQVDDLESAKTILSQLLPTYLFSGLRYYDSGRSVHAYGSTLLRPFEWREFMGKLLLVNLPGKPQFVDTRWIGHRILGGYSALRFSCNSSEYLQHPELIN